MEIKNMKPKLILNKSQFDRPGSTLGMRAFLHTLGKSELFEIDYHNDYLNAMRGQRGTTIYYNGKKIYLDLWEYQTPCHTHEAYEENFDLIIKVQHNNVAPKTYNRYCNRKGFLSKLTDDQRTEFLDKIVPWTFFPSGMFRQFIGKEDDLHKENYPIERDCFFCGKAWRCRGPIFKTLKEQNIECLTSSQEIRSGRTLNNDQFLHNMRSSKYGLVLAGRSTIITDSKNRREIDYMMLKKPLLLNYKPFYYNPLVEGEHYIFIDQSTKIDELEKKYNIDEIAQNGYDWYQKNATPEAIPLTFSQIMKERLNV